MRLPCRSTSRCRPASRKSSTLQRDEWGRTQLDLVLWYTYYLVGCSRLGDLTHDIRCCVHWIIGAFSSRDLAERNVDDQRCDAKASAGGTDQRPSAQRPSKLVRL